MNSTIKWLLVIISAVTIGGGIFAAYGAQLQSITNSNTGTGSNPPEPDIITVSYETVTVDDGDPVDWGTWTVGTNNKELSVFNKHTSLIQVFLYVTDLPADWTLSWSHNGTAWTSGATKTADVIVTVPSSIVDGQVYSFNSSVVAEQ